MMTSTPVNIYILCVLHCKLLITMWTDVLL